jgi:hypothetical protein
MLTVKKLRRKPKHFHNFTGLTLSSSTNCSRPEPLYEQAEQERLENPNRLRARGAGRNFDLELSERLLMSLMYFRLYVTQTLLGYLFDLDSSNVNREINGRMLAVLSEVLPVPARDEPLPDLAAQAAQEESASGGSDGGGGGGGGKGSARRGRRSAPSKSCSKSTRSSKRSSSTVPSKSCPSPGQGPSQRPLQRQTQEAHRQDAGA